MKRIISWIIKGLCGIMLYFPSLAQPAAIIQDSAFYFKSRLPPESVKFTLRHAVFSKEADGHFNFGLSRLNTAILC